MYVACIGAHYTNISYAGNFDPAHPPNPTETATLQFYCSSHSATQCISQNPQYFLINFWQVSGQAPSSGNQQEVVLTSFTYQAN